MTIGAMLAGKIIQSGRRSAHLICIGIGTVGVSLTLISNFYFLITGRLIYGFASGIFTVANVRMIEEYVPLH